jgi:two-component system response regulator DesR
MSEIIRVVLADDQGMLRGALAALLSIEPDMEVLATCSDGEEAMRAVNRDPPDILVTDIEMPKMSGLELAAKVHERYPRIGIVILTIFARPGYLRRALDAGASAYLLKDRPSEDLTDIIRRVRGGAHIVDPALAAEIWAAERDSLSGREREILRRAGTGETTIQIAKAFRLSEGTVRNYLSGAIAKLGASNRTEAAHLAKEKGWL